MPPVTLITGATTGIGRALSEHYVAIGHDVVGCSRGESDLQSPNYAHFGADVGDESSVKRLLSFVRTTFGRIDNLINNAGIAAMNHALLTPASTVERVLRTNTLGTFLASREAAKVMRKSGGGRIVNLSTIAVPLNLEGEAAYVASKAAVEALTRVLAREFADMRITVNAVGPGPIPTELLRGVPPAAIENLIARQAIRRQGSVADVINVTDFFLSPSSDFITGQVIYLGGIT